jgi:hypothetical protein
VRRCSVAVIFIKRRCEVFERLWNFLDMVRKCKPILYFQPIPATIPVDPALRRVA